MLTGKKTLYAFGDSFTYGHGFPDCLTSITGPSIFPYPNILAKKYGYDLKNCSAPGSSPLAQFYRFHFKYPEMQSGDVVTFLWPFSMRSAILNEQHIEEINDTSPFPIEEVMIMPGESTSMGPDNETVIDLEQWYMDYTSRFHSVILLTTYMNSVLQMCKAKNIKCCQLLLHCRDLSDIRLLQHKNIEQTAHFRDWQLQSNSLEIYIRDDRTRNRINKSLKLDCGFLPDGHFNLDAHKLWAQIYSKKISNLELDI